MREADEKKHQRNRPTQPGGICLCFSVLVIRRLWVSRIGGSGKYYFGLLKHKGYI